MNVINFTGYKTPLKKYAKDNHIPCAYCGEPFTDTFTPTAEHIKPKSCGGKNSDVNFLTICDSDNNIRDNYPLSCFLEEFPEAATHIKENLDKCKPYVSGSEGIDGTYKNTVQKALVDESDGLLQVCDGDIKPTEQLETITANKSEKIGAKFLDRNPEHKVKPFVRDMAHHKGHKLNTLA